MKKIDIFNKFSLKVKSNAVIAKIAFPFLVAFLIAISSFNANAQCSAGITVTWTSTPAQCPNSGTITATFSNIDNIDLALSQYAIQGAMTRPFSNANCMINPSTRTFVITGLVAGTYDIQIRAFCYSTNSIDVNSFNRNGLVVGTAGATAPSFTNLTGGSTFSCVSAGTLTVTSSGGANPYFEITGGTHSPSQVGRQFPLGTGTSTVVGGDLPGGTYTGVVKDACGYTSAARSASITITKELADAIVNKTATVQMWRYSTYNNCKDIYPCFGIENNTQLEYCYSTSTTTPASGWADCPANPVYTLPSNYAVYCAGSPSLYLHLRAKACPATNGYFTCQFNRFICSSGANVSVKGQNYTTGTGNTTDNTNEYSPFNIQENAVLSTCSLFTASARVIQYFGICYPATVTVTRQSDGAVILPAQTMTTDGIVPGLSGVQFTGGVTYVFSITSAAGGNSYTQTWTPAINGQNFGMFTNNQTGSSDGCGTGIPYYPAGAGRYLEIRVGGPDRWYAGTIVEQTAGPTIPGWTIGVPYTLPSNLGTSFFDIANKSGTNNWYAIYPGGTYTFKVTPPTGCGSTQTVSITLAPPFAATQDDWPYTTQKTCDGLVITPTGRMKYLDGTLQPASGTFFKINSGPAGVGTYCYSGGSLTLSGTGTYKIGMSGFATPASASGCWHEKTFVVDNDLNLDWELTSAYACLENPYGSMYLKGKGKDGVYLFTVSDRPGATMKDGVTPVPPIAPQSNTTGNFPNIGVPGGTYNVNIASINCGGSLDVPVTILDLREVGIAYTFNKGMGMGVFCEGPKEIGLCCILLGELGTYQWRQVPNPTVLSSSRCPNLDAFYPASSGLYDVTAIPFNCTLPVLDTVQITILPAPNVNVPNNILTFCQNTGTYNIVTLSGVSTALPLNWFDASKNPISPPTAYSTTTLGTTTYYVAQANATCDGILKPVTINVNPAGSCGDPCTATVTPSGSQDRTLCIGTELFLSTGGNITYTTTGVSDPSDIEVTGLPAGVSAQWAGNTLTISGTPSESGSFPYSIMLKGNCMLTPMGNAGTITVKENTVILHNGASGPVTQSVCPNAHINNIVFTIVGDATVTGIPSKASVSTSTPIGYTLNGSMLTISGTETSNVTFNYTISGVCGSDSKSGTITVSSVTPAVSIAAVPPGEICTGTSVTFTATPTAHQGTNPTYEWFVNGTSQGAAAAGNTSFSSSTLANGDNVTCKMTSNANCASPATVTATPLTIEINKCCDKPTVVQKNKCK